MSSRWSSFRRELRALRDAPSGRRFADRYERKHSEGIERPANRLVYITAGAVICTAGLVLRLAPFLPGGTALFVWGGALMSRESLTAARLLDRTEMALARMWERVRKPFRD